MNIKTLTSTIGKTLKRLYKSGFFTVIASQVIVKVVGFCNSIFLARLLSKGDYGIYSYAQNYLSVLLLLDGLGTISAIVQFGSENYDSTDRQLAFTKFGFSIGCAFNSILSLAIFVYALVGKFSIDGSGSVLAVMAFQPIMSYIVSFFSINLRYRLENKLFSICNIVNSVLNISAVVVGAIVGGVYGVAASLYFSYLISILLYVAVFIKLKVNPFGKSSKLSIGDKKGFVKLSISAAVNDSILHLIMVADLFIIGVLIADELVVASYKVATTIPSALVFIPSSLMLFAYPYMARNKSDYRWNRKILISIVAALGAINTIIVVILAVWAPFFITLIYGDAYLDAVPIFRVLLIGYLFTGTFRTPIVNFLWSQKRNKMVVGLSVFIGIFNIIADIILVKAQGAIGAAIATTATYFASAVLAIIFALVVMTDIKKSKQKPTLKDGNSVVMTSNGHYINETNECGSIDTKKVLSAEESGEGVEQEKEDAENCDSEKGKNVQSVDNDKQNDGGGDDE